MRHQMKLIAAASVIALAAAGSAAVAGGQYDPGASDTEIKIGNTSPYSGPASAYGADGRSEAGYFAMINDQGGVNGRKINFITRDDGYSPPKTVEQVRKLVEEDQVLFLFSTLGTPGWSLDEVIAGARRYGYDGVELRLLDGEIITPALPQSERSASGMFCNVSRLKGSGPVVVTTESSRRRSTWSGWTRAYASSTFVP